MAAGRINVGCKRGSSIGPLAASLLHQQRPRLPTQPPSPQGDSGTDAFRCVQQREGTPWLWQADAYGVAATAHVALQGRYLEVERVRGVGSGAHRAGLRGVADACLEELQLKGGPPIAACPRTAPTPALLSNGRRGVPAALPAPQAPVGGRAVGRVLSPPAQPRGCAAARRGRAGSELRAPALQCAALPAACCTPDCLRIAWLPSSLLQTPLRLLRWTTSSPGLRGTCRAAARPRAACAETCRPPRRCCRGAAEGRAAALPVPCPCFIDSVEFAIKSKSIDPT